MRELLGVLFKDFFRYQYVFFSRGNNYLSLVNRLERVSLGPDERSYVCLWPYTSKLHAPLILPFLGKQLLKASRTNSTFAYSDSISCEKDIDISILIGHRGMERLPLLLATLRSFAAQVHVRLECIIIEQDYQPQIRDYLPEWITYLFQKTNQVSTAYNRSAAFNFGANYARGNVLLLHDNDMLAPINYCSDILRLANIGYDAINLKRFVFYLGQNDSADLIQSIDYLKYIVPEYIIQNLEAGGSVAIKRSAFFRIGGMDEEFVGWGGEDIEFWKRCTTLKRWIWGRHSLIHLWHKSQPLKHTEGNPNIQRVNRLEEIQLNARIDLLRKKNWGNEYD